MTPPTKPPLSYANLSNSAITALESNLKTRIIMALLLFGLFGYTAYHFAIKHDNNSLVKMLDHQIERNRYYLDSYVPGFGKDEFIFAAIPVEGDPSDEFMLLADLRGKLRSIEIRVCRGGVQPPGRVLWPGESCEQPPPDCMAARDFSAFSQCLRRTSFPVSFPLEEDNGRVLLTDLGPRTRAIPVECHPDGINCWFRPVVSTVDIVDFAQFQELRKALSGETPSATSLLSPTKEALLAASRLPPARSFVTSNIVKVRDDGEDEHHDDLQYLAVMAEIRDLAEADSLREVILAHIRGLESAIETPDLQVAFAGVPILNAQNTQEVLIGHVVWDHLLFGMLILGLLAFFRKHWRLFICAVAILLATVIITLGSFSASGRSFTWLTSVLPIVLIVTAVSDIIHILLRYRDAPPETRISTILKAMIVPCFYTSITTALGFLLLALTTDVAPIQDFGYFGFFGVCAAFLLTFLICLIITEPLPKSPPQEPAATESERTTDTDIRLPEVAATPADSALLRKIFNSILAKHAVKLTALLGVLTLVSAILLRNVPWGADARGFYDDEAPLTVDFRVFEERFHGGNTYALTFTEGTDQTDCHEPGIRVRLGIECTLLPAIDELDAVEICLGPRTWRNVREFAAGLPAIQCPESRYSAFECYKYEGQSRRVAATTHSLVDLVGTSAETPGEAIAALRLIAMFEEGNRAIRRFFNVFDPDPSADLQPPSGCSTRILRATRAGNSELWVEISERIHDELEQKCDSEPTGCTARLTGMTEVFNRMSSDLLHDMLRSFQYSALLILGSVVVMLRRKRWLALLSLIPNIVPFVLIPGCMALLAVPVDFITLMVFTVAVGLIVDNTIHLCHSFATRLDEHAKLQGKPALGLGAEPQVFQGALREAYQQTGGAVVATSAILAGGFLVLLHGEFQAVTRVGNLLFIVIVVAFVADFIFFPAILLCCNKIAARLRRKDT